MPEIGKMINKLRRAIEIAEEHQIGNIEIVRIFLTKEHYKQTKKEFDEVLGKQTNGFQLLQFNGIDILRAGTPNCPQIFRGEEQVSFIELENDIKILI
jgi:hypothetical protein